MTMQQLGFFALKLLGLTYAFAAVFHLVWMLGLLTAPPSEALPSSRSLAINGVTSVIANSLFAFFCLALTSTVSVRMFGDDSEDILEPKASEHLLAAGVILLGVVFLGSNLTGAVMLLGELVWNLEASRRPLLWETLRLSYYQFGPSLGGAVTGVVLVFGGSRIARSLSPWRRDEEK